MRSKSRILKRLSASGEALRRLSLNMADAGVAAQFSHELIILQSRWEQFVREYLLEWAARDRFALSAVSRQHKNLVLAAFMSTRGSREPNWAMPDQAIAFAVTMRLSERPDIVATLGSTPWPLEGLRHHRNFTAHLSEEAAKKLMRYSGLGVNDNLHRYPVDYESGTPRYQFWISKMKTIVTTLPG